MNQHHSKPMHQMRHAPQAPKRGADAPAKDYTPGHFTALVRLHNFPPRFEARLGRHVEAWRSEIATANREAQVAIGNTGTILGLSDKAVAHPVQQRIASGKYVA